MSMVKPLLRQAALLLGLTAAPILAPVTARPAAAGPLYCPQTETHVAVLGDSLADGVWGALFRGWLGCETLKLYRVTEVGDGLAKSDVDVWSERLTGAIVPASGAEPRADLMVIQMGANDIRAIRDGSSRAVFGTEEWDKLYGARTASLLEAARGLSDSVIWLGLPVVGDDKLEGYYSHVSALQDDAVTARAETDPQVQFVEMHEATTFGTGGYVQSVTLDDRLTQLRASDRIHFSERGYDLVVEVFNQKMEQRLKTGDLEANLNELVLQ